MTRVVVLGAGYAGLVAAKRLARQVDRAQVSITLVNAEPRFVERIRLHQLAAGQPLADLPLRKILDGSGVAVLIGRVRRIDLANRAVHVGTETGEQVLRYDTLVYALGSVTNVDSVPGAAEHAAALSGPAAVERLAVRLRELAERRGVVVVCGGGLTGIETAAELGESHPGLTVRMVTRGEPGGWLSPGARRYLGHQLARLGVEVIRNAEVTRVEPRAVVLADGSRVYADIALWTGGFAACGLAREAGLAVNERGRVLVDETLRSVSHPEVYAIGDAVAASGKWGQEMSFGCRTGGFTGPYAADAIARRLAGRTPGPFRFRYLHQCISLGRRRGLIQFVHATDESPKRTFLRGRIAARYKEIVSSSAVWLFRHPGPYLLGRKT
ncbi:FAD-dependent oxidoreductase [Saccharopolyspora sp. K220]|uniref:NAD(P)/FAD-dependent oxidoreductase n=1 Tax=Saccharopolyspora soli TaxID=2926618 RepID=UPI001F56066E|nr:FAD-dependent oxidoreductase [Saccharopolyspora soli]MCI2423225.1 FAD-dependent oxidoreductase [Saccharopolyspora soli]